MRAEGAGGRGLVVGVERSVEAVADQEHHEGKVHVEVDHALPTVHWPHGEGGAPASCYLPPRFLGSQ